MTEIRSVSVFCGASTGVAEGHRDCAARAGRLFAENGIRIIYGGGRVGLMGILADAALAAGGEVIGVIPTFLHEREVAHPGLTEMHVVSSMHERKRHMFELSQATCSLPGGLGTLDETIEVVTWRQLDLHDRPVVVVNADGYWDALKALTEHAVGAGFAPQRSLDLLTFVDTPEDALRAILAAPAPRRAAAGARL